MNKLSRLYLVAKDIRKITGLSHSTATRISTEVRRHANKPPRSRISVEDFCSYTKLSEARVRELLL